MHVLFIDDDLLVAEALAERLRQTAHTVTILTSCEELLAEKFLFYDVALVDIYLNDAISGPECISMLSQTHNIPSVALSANSDPLTLTRIQHTPAYGFVHKLASSAHLEYMLALAVKLHAEHLRVHAQVEQLRQDRELYETRLLKMFAGHGPSLSEMTTWFEQQVIQAVLSECDGNQTQAAERLGISRQTLLRKLAHGHAERSRP